MAQKVQTLFIDDIEVFSASMSQAFTA